MKQQKPTRQELIIAILNELPTHDTAVEIRDKIMEDLYSYFKNDDAPYLKNKTYTFTPKETFLKEYFVEIDFRPSNNNYMIGYASENYIEIKYLNKSSREFESVGTYPLNRLSVEIYNILKHECSHFYLKSKGFGELLYHTHPQGLKKYYEDDEEMVLHGTEIFDRIIKRFPNWKTMDRERLIKEIASEVKYLPSRTNIHFPFTAATQKKYIKTIFNYLMKLK
jgi:hypothetical protein